MINFLKRIFGKKRTKRKGIEIIDLIKEKPSFRRTGHTTRIADKMIQVFFESEKNKKISYNDHYFESRSGDDHLRNIIERRLIEEHRLKKDEDFFSSYSRNGNVLIKKF